MARSGRKTRIGSVVSDGMEKTIIVSVERRFSHPFYGKQVTRSKRYYAHDEGNRAHSGDVVLIAETRPLSKTKRWRLVEILRKAE
jgi:small subunit ribosomal protein S17